jgi:hypothetical protein
MEFQLFEDTVVQLRGVSKRGSGTKNFTWAGEGDVDPNQYGVLVVRDGRPTGTIHADGRVFLIRPASSGMVTLAEVDPSVLPAGADSGDVAPLENQGDNLVGDLVDAGEVWDDPSRIDVMILYTDDAAAAEFDLEATLLAVVEETNQTFRRSGIAHRLRLVHMEEVEYEETGLASWDRARLMDPSDEIFGEYHLIRDRYAADVVFLVTEMGIWCGMAPEPVDDLSTEHASSAFAVVKRSCATKKYSLAHELGHIFAARHDRETEGGGGADSYGYGFVYPDGPWRTIMAHDTSCRARPGVGTCPRLGFWSNPDLQYQGVPAGIERGSEGAADNRTLLNQNGATVANFRVGAGLGHNEALDHYGSAVAMGDFDNDGYDDLVVGAPYEATARSMHGGFVYVYQGSELGLYPWMSVGPDELVDGEYVSLFGAALAAADFNGDGYDDLAVGAPGFATDGESRVGAVFIYEGSSTGLRSSDRLEARDPESGADFGASLAAGDFWQDGVADLAVGAPFKDYGWGCMQAGQVTVFLGIRGRSPRWGPVNGLSRHGRVLDQSVTDQNEWADRFGHALAVGDFDGDGDDDLAVSSPFDTAEQDGEGVRSGRVHIFSVQLLPVGSGIRVMYPRVSFDQTGLGANEEDDRFGWSLASGDFDNDGKDDLAVGASREGVGSGPAGGYVFVFRGANSYHTGHLVPWFGQSQRGLGINETGDQYGSAMVAGDLNNDGYDDLVVGAQGEGPGTPIRSGIVFLYRGSPERLRSWLWLDQVPLGERGDGDYFGSAIAVGDVDGDDFADFIVGAHGKDCVQGIDCGQAFAFAGSDGPPELWLALTQEAEDMVF